MAIRHDEIDRVEAGAFLQVCPAACAALEPPADATLHGAASPKDSRDGTVDITRDQELVARCQAGDQRAFDELYSRYHRRLHRYCLQRVGESHDAEDVVQEAFLRAWGALPRFAGERRFYPWLTVIAGNLCVDTLRRRARQTPVEESRITSFDTGSYETEDAVLHDDDSTMVATAFRQLSTRHQRVLQMREGSDWSYRQIAEHEGLGITAVETLLWRARQALKREFLLLDEQQGKVGALIGFLVLLPARLVARMPGAMKQVSHGAGRVSAGIRHAAGALGWFGSGTFSDGGASSVFGAIGPSVAAVTGIVALGVGTVLMLPATGAPGQVPARPPATVPAAPSLATSFPSRTGNGSTDTAGASPSLAVGGRGSEATSPSRPGGPSGIAGASSTGSSTGSGSGSIANPLGYPDSTFGGPATSRVGSDPLSQAATSIGTALGGVVHRLGSADVSPQAEGSTTSSLSTVVNGTTASVEGLVEEAASGLGSPGSR